MCHFCVNINLATFQRFLKKTVEQHDGSLPARVGGFQAALFIRFMRSLHVRTEWQSCFCPGTSLVSGIQGSRWGPGFLQDQTKLTLIPGGLLLQRNKYELFVWWFFLTL